MRLLLTASQAATELGLSRSKTYELIASGRLVSVQVDGCRRIRRDDLHAFIRSLGQGQAEAPHPRP